MNKIDTQHQTKILKRKVKEHLNFQIFILQKQRNIQNQIRFFIKNFKSILPITNGEIAIYEDDDKLAGYIYIGGGDKYTNRNYGFIQTLEVIKKYRGYGLSNKLLEDAIKKYHAIDLVVSVHNEVAVRLYKKHGFVIIGYSSDKKDEYWMKLKSKLDKDDKIIIK